MYCGSNMTVPRIDSKRGGGRTLGLEIIKNIIE